MSREQDGRRVARVEKEVHQAVASYILQSLQRELPGIVTVSRVKMPGDLKTAKVYVSLLASVDSPAVDDKVMDETLDVLQDAAPEIQHFLNKELQLRFCPKLSFFADETTQTALRVESLLHDISKKNRGDA